LKSYGAVLDEETRTHRTANGFTGNRTCSEPRLYEVIIRTRKPRVASDLDIRKTLRAKQAGGVVRIGTASQ